MTTTALDRAIEILGSQDALAQKLGIRSPSISGFRKRGRVPAERCIAIEQATDGQVTRYDLRPDVFGQPPHTQPAERAGEPVTEQRAG